MPPCGFCSRPLFLDELNDDTDEVEKCATNSSIFMSYESHLMPFLGVFPSFNPIVTFRV